MKKILLIFLFCIFSHAKTYSDIYEAQTQALQEAKLMVFIIVSDRCHFCQKYMQDINQNAKLLEFLDEKMILTITNLEDENARIPSDLGFSGVTPTTIITTPTGKRIGQPMPGAIKSHDLHVYLQGLEIYKKEKVGF